MESHEYWGLAALALIVFVVLTGLSTGWGIRQNTVEQTESVETSDYPTEFDDRGPVNGSVNVDLVNYTCVDGFMYFGARTGVGSYDFRLGETPSGHRLVLTVELEPLFNHDGLPVMCPKLTTEKVGE